MGEKFSFSPFTSYPKIVIKENAITSPANYFPFITVQLNATETLQE